MYGCQVFGCINIFFLTNNFYKYSISILGRKDRVSRLRSVVSILCSHYHLLNQNFVIEIFLLICLCCLFCLSIIEEGVLMFPHFDFCFICLVLSAMNSSLVLILLPSFLSLLACVWNVLYSFHLKSDIHIGKCKKHDSTSWCLLTKYTSSALSSLTSRNRIYQYDRCPHGILWGMNHGKYLLGSISHPVHVTSSCMGYNLTMVNGVCEWKSLFLRIIVHFLLHTHELERIPTFCWKPYCCQEGWTSLTMKPIPGTQWRVDTGDLHSGHIIWF